MNIGTPIPDPRLQVMAELNAAIDQFFAAGKQVNEIPTGLSGEGEPNNPHQRKRRAAREAEAPMVRELVAKGMNAYEVAEVMKTSHTRVRLIARENGISLGGPS